MTSNLESASSSTTKVRASKEFADRIKAHHTKIRQQADQVGAASVSETKKTKDDDNDKNAEEAWKLLKQDKIALSQYSSDMFELATKYWKHGETMISCGESLLTTNAHDGQNNGNNIIAAATIEEQEYASIHRKSDRLLYILEMIHLYFVGGNLADSSTLPSSREKKQDDDDNTATAGTRRQRNDGETNAEKKLTTIPSLISSSLKEFKRNSWKELQRSATNEECHKFIQDFISVELLQKSFFDVNKKSTQNLIIVDIGSCYNPLRNLILNPPIPSLIAGDDQDNAKKYEIRNTRGSIFERGPESGDDFTIDHFEPVSIGLDLHPYNPRLSGVIQCDWHDVKMENRNEENNNADHASTAVVAEINIDGINPSSSLEMIVDKEIHREHQIAKNLLFSNPTIVSNIAEDDQNIILSSQIESVDTFYRNSAHVVTFCLMLSYLPSPTMRLRCCFNAFHFLKEHGLFIILSTRTQNSRKSNWENQWIESLEKIGFERFRKDVRMKLVGLCFRKLSHEEAKKKGCYFENFDEVPENVRRQGLPIRADDDI